MNEAKIAVVILTLDKREDTLRCIRSLANVASPPFRVFVWDNGSSDETGPAIHAEFPHVTYHRHPTNLGAGQGRNAGTDLALQHCTPTHLLFLDNDATVAPDFLAPLLEPFERDPLVGQTSAKIRCLDDPERIYVAVGSKIQFWWGDTSPIGHGEIDRGQYDQSVPCVASTGCTLVRADVFREVGGFDPAFDPYGYEDLDLSLRIASAGYRVMYTPRSVAFHERGQTFERGRYSPLYAKVKARNWLRFMRRHARPHQWLAFLVIGAPYRFTTTLIREARRGNARATLGLLRGLFARGSTD